MRSKKKIRLNNYRIRGRPPGGSMMLFNSSRSMYHVLKNFLEFFEEESCGQCTRAGLVPATAQGYRIDPVRRTARKRYLADLKKLATAMSLASKCGLGQSVANPFNTIVDNFKDEICY
jgi:[NiFe] hydrogenase diaphorase moiety large subunit